MTGYSICWGLGKNLTVDKLLHIVMSCYSICLVPGNFPQLVIIAFCHVMLFYLFGARYIPTVGKLLHSVMSCYSICLGLGKYSHF